MPRTGALRRSPVALAVVLGLALVASLLVQLGGRAPVAVAAGGAEFVTLRSVDGGFSHQPWLVDAGGSFVRRLTTQDAVSQPAVSSDGTTVVFAGPQNDSDSLGRYGLFVVGTDGSGFRPFTAPRFGDLDPSLHPDGARVLFTRNTDGSLTTSCCALYEVGLDGAGTREIPNTRNGRQGVYTPDGRTVVFVGSGGLRSVDRSGASARLVAAGSYADPQVSPDGRTVAVTLVRSPDRSDLALVDLASGSVRVLYTSKARVEDPQWSPDSRTVLVLEHGGQGYLGRTGSFVRAVPVDGSFPPVVADPPGEIVELATAGARHDVFGALDALQQAPGEVRARGWAIDPDTTAPVDVEVVVDGAVAAREPAADPRPDVGAANPGLGSDHGFDLTVPLAPGRHTVCVRGRDEVAPGRDPVVLGCRDFPGTPVGALDTVRLAPGGVRVTGWALDPDVATPVDVHVYVDDKGYAFTAEQSRPDVAAAYPGYGDRHGYSVDVPVPTGRHTVCVYAIGVGAGPNTQLRCEVVEVTGRPFGALDTVRPSPGGVQLTGWALDPDTAAPVDVHVYVDDKGYAFTAGQSRPDVAAAYPGYGDRHGYTVDVPVPVGTHTVCVYAIGVGAGGNTQVRCEVVQRTVSPVGFLDDVRGVAGGVRVSGWTLDPDTTDPVQVHVYVDSAGYAFVADGSRPDVASRYPGYGPAHGFSVTVPVPAGQHRVCAYGINVGAGQNVELGCRTVTR